MATFTIGTAHVPVCQKHKDEWLELQGPGKVERKKLVSVLDNTTSMLLDLQRMKIKP